MELPFHRNRSSIGESGALFLGLAVALTAFGILMIYSASSIMALTSKDYGYNPGYFAFRQLAFAAIGAVMAAILSRFDYHTLTGPLLVAAWVGTVLLLLAIFSPLAGADAYGATRWIAVGPLHLQPSEFAKATLLLCTALLCQEFFEDGTLDLRELAIRAGILLLIPLLLVLRQPDKGTVLIVVMTATLMLFLSGMPIREVGIIAAIAVVGILFLAFKDDYSRARIMMMNNPWIDEYGDGYQLVQGYYAFGSGGIFGVGLGMSRQKYSYLPMAHNDFIFAVIGEELGLVGTLTVLLAFFLLAWLGFKIAREAHDLTGKLIAAGSVSMLCLQLLVNVCGVLGLIPLSGKPIPFLSYGGSSIMSTLILVGLTLSVARTTQSEQGARGRSDFAVWEGSEPRGLRVIRGGMDRTPDSIRRERNLSASYGSSRISVNANGTRRIDLGPTGSERLRRAR